jgi:LacI family transcriptional regulator
MSRQKKPAILPDVAAPTGVSPMTDSRVINQSGHVKAEALERVLRAVRKMGYRRNGLARGLKRNRRESIGPFVGNISNPFAPELNRGVREILEPRGYSLFICISEHNAREDVLAFDALSDHRVDGAIIATRAARLGNERLVSLPVFRLA